MTGLQRGSGAKRPRKQIQTAKLLDTHMGVDGAAQLFRCEQLGTKRHSAAIIDFDIEHLGRDSVSRAQPAQNRFTEKNLNMSHSHAVVWTDHQSPQVLQFDAEHMRVQRIRSHHHYTRQHGSAVRTEHEFFGEFAMRSTPLPRC